ncbi:MAG: beta-ketoacyl synthase N-terminal-like domain-containing protein [Bacteroidota bacterium]
MNTNEVENMEGKIAIIGMDCRLPGAKNIYEYWKNLINGVESLSTFTDEELIATGVEPAVFKQPNYVRNRGIIGGAEYFDAEFFGITPREAELMDPQQRVFLECAWHALEDAGCNPYTAKERIGVFGGTGTPLHLVSAMGNSQVKKNASGASIVTSNDKDYVTTRVSYKLNLTGPSVNVQCACSTSMVAVVMGINSLMSYQSDMIIAGGATIELPEKHGYLYQAGGMESADGHCHTFDKEANGTVFSRGCGIVVMKRLEDAIRDNNNIYAVILGGAINNDGNKKAGFTAPSVEGQVEVITEALALSEVSADTITYVEAHGTATHMGDPIEVASLTDSFRKHSDRKQYCAIGSVKTNIGHCDIASGAASLIKTALCLKNRQIPASLHFNEANPQIDFPNSPFFVNTELRNWKPENGTPLRAIVNAFGVGGTNACVILEEPPQASIASKELPCDLLLVSGRSPEAVAKSQADIKAFIESFPDIDPHAVAFTSRYGRQHFLNRLAIPFRNREELLKTLETRNSTPLTSAEKRPLVFMFPGQGNQYIRMGLPLYETHEVFRKTIDECSEILKEELGFDIRTVLFPTPAFEEEASLKINETYITQPALFIVSYATAKLLISLGIEPDMLIGHSVGEYVAATVSGVFSLKDALKAVARRGKLVQALPGGAMLAVLLTEEQLNPLLPAGLEIAVVNSPGLCVASGPESTIDRFAAELNKTKTFNKKIPTSHAFHSAMMDPALPAFAEFFREIQLSTPRIPIASTVTGQWLSAEEATNPDFWVQHVRKTVRFGDAAKLCLDLAPAVFVESGPGQSLESAVKRQLAKDTPHGVISSIPSLDTKTDPLLYFYSCLGQIWACGDYFNWKLFDQKSNKLVSYPGYPFERKPYSIDFSQKDGVKGKTESIKKTDINQWFYVPGWKRTAPPQHLHANGMTNTEQAADKPCWLLFADEEGLCHMISKELEAADHSCFMVKKGKGFTRNQLEFVLDASRKDHYHQLLKALKSEGFTPGNIIYAWNYGKKPQSGHLDPLNAEQLAEDNFYSPLYLEQAIISEGFLKNIFLLFVVNYLYDVTGEPVLAPEKALAVGAARVVGQEHPGIIARLVDLPPVSGSEDLNKLGALVIGECRLSADENVVAYRNGYRWIEDFTQLSPEEDTLTEKALTENGVYLITGGVGGIGLELAKFIARSVKAVLVLTHRSPLPLRNEWDELLASSRDDDSNTMRVRGILELESLGATVIPVLLDASDYEGTKALISRIEQEYGMITGVLHSAGMPGAGVISLKEKHLAELVLHSKLNGTLILHDIFRERPLDFFFLFSSVSSIFGEAARVDYCGSNSFMDSFSQYRKSIAKDGTISVNWGQWGLIGMGANWEKAKAEKKKKLQSGNGLTKDPKRNGIRLDFFASENEQDIYFVDIDPERDWVLNSHLLSGKPAFIGVSTLEILNLFAKIKNPAGHLEGLSFSFVMPLIYEAGIDRKLRLLVKTSAKVMSFRISSKEEKSGSAREIWMDHVKGEFKIGTGVLEETIDILALSERVTEKTDLSSHFLELLNDEGRSVLKYDNRWDCKMSNQYNGKEFLAEIKLRDEFLDDLTYYSFHPAMLDVATSCNIPLVNKKLYLPYSYKNVVLHHSLPAHFWCHATLSDDWKLENDEMKFHVRIIDKNNRLLISIGEVSFKQLMQNFGNAKQEQSSAEPQKLAREAAAYTTWNDILPEEGVEVFKKLLSCKQFPQIIIHPTDLPQDILEERPSYKKREKQEKEEVKSVSSSAYERPKLSTPYETPSNAIEIGIAEIWKSILGIDKIGVNDTFVELGGNSLLAIQTISNIADEFEIELQPNIFFENPTVKKLADRIVEMIISMKSSDEIEAMLNEIENE